MKKDVVYIDTEDDITSIISRVKDSNSNIVALVPPKRVGVLQSIVNLKLLKRAAEQADRRIVLITNDAALTGLAAGLSLPVAKNLQSKPEISSIEPVDSSDDDVIEGEEIVLDKQASVEDMDVESDDAAVPRKALGTAAFSGRSVKKTSSLAKKLPNFDAFRKKLFFIIGGVVVMAGVLVWALIFAPEADVTIKARTNVVNINKVLQVRDGAKLDAGQNILPSVVKQIKKTETADVTATGKKDVGEKATGSVKLTNSDFSAVTLNAGVVLKSSNGMQYVTNNTVTVPKGTCKSTSSCTPGSTMVGVTAAASGPAYNGAVGDMTSSAFGDFLSATLTSPTAGGTTKEVTVISQEDVDKAAEQLKTADANVVREELKKQFTSAEIAISEAFVVEPGNPSVSPAVGQESATAKLSLETTYTIVGFKRTDLVQVYTAFINSEINSKKNQKIYETGDKTTKFSEFVKSEGGYTIRATATAQVGPNIDQEKLKEDIAGLREGDVREKINSIDGVEDVDVKFPYFWVNTIPNDSKKIHITFTMANGN